MTIGTYTPPPGKIITQIFFQFFFFFFHFRCILLQISHQKCFFISIFIRIFFQIWEFACRCEAMRIARGVQGHAPPRKFFETVQFGAF